MGGVGLFFLSSLASFVFESMASGFCVSVLDGVHFFTIMASGLFFSRLWRPVLVVFVEFGVRCPFVLGYRVRCVLFLEYGVRCSFLFWNMASRRLVLLFFSSTAPGRPVFFFDNFMLMTAFGF